MIKKFCAVLIFLCTLFLVVGCQTNNYDTELSVESTQSNIDKSLKLYPLSTEESKYFLYSYIPEIIFSTTGAENGLSGNIYSFSGIMVGQHPELGPSYFVVATKYGVVLMMNIYNDVKDELPVEEEKYIIPEVGEDARFTCIYDGFSTVAGMPCFAYGNDELLLSSYLDSDEETSFEKPSAEESKTAEQHKHSFDEGKCSQCGATDPDYKPISVSKQNALKKAKSYLSHSAFSKQGLIEQLEYEQFAHEDAVYAAENCGANWSEQSLKKAKSYLSHSAFSKQGLIEQLEYEKFTTEQAKYGVDNCGANWNEQAAKKAKSYLSHSSFSRQKLIEQLEFEGFTHEQAVYGVNSAGL